MRSYKSAKKKTRTLLLLSENSGNKSSFDVFCQFIYLYIYIYLFISGISIISCRLVGSNDFGKKKLNFSMQTFALTLHGDFSSGALKFEPIPTFCAQPGFLGDSTVDCMCRHRVKDGFLMIPGVFNQNMRHQSLQTSNCNWTKPIITSTYPPLCVLC